MPTINIVRPFELTLANGTKRRFNPGSHDVPDDIANHWYVRAHTDNPPPVRHQPGTAGFVRQIAASNARKALLSTVSAQEAQQVLDQHREAKRAAEGSEVQVMTHGPNVAGPTDPGFVHGGQGTAPINPGLTPNVSIGDNVPTSFPAGTVATVVKASDSGLTAAGPEPTETGTYDVSGGRSGSQADAVKPNDEKAPPAPPKSTKPDEKAPATPAQNSKK